MLAVETNSLTKNSIQARVRDRVIVQGHIMAMLFSARRFLAFVYRVLTQVVWTWSKPKTAVMYAEREMDSTKKTCCPLRPCSIPILPNFPLSAVGSELGTQGSTQGEM